MTATLAPFGFAPDNHRSAYGTRGETAYPAGIPSAYNTSIYKGQPVALSSGVIVAVSANNVDMVGIFAGCEYTDITGRRRVSNFWPANTAMPTGETCTAYVWDDPNVIFEVQADGTVAATAVGGQVNLTNGSNGSTVTGLSQATVGATPVGTGVQGQFRVEGIALRPDNAWGDAYPILRVSIARHQYVASKTSL